MSTQSAACVVSVLVLIACAPAQPQYTNPGGATDGSLTVCGSGDFGCMFPDAGHPQTDAGTSQNDAGMIVTADGGINFTECTNQPSNGVSAETTANGNLILVEVNTGSPQFVEFFNPGQNLETNAGIYSIVTQGFSAVLSVGEVMPGDYAVMQLHSNQTLNPAGGDILLESQVAGMPVQYVCWGATTMASNQQTAITDNLWDVSSCPATNSGATQLTGPTILSEESWSVGTACVDMPQ